MLNIKTSQSDFLANQHYEGVKYYVEQVLDFYINFFDIINGNKNADDALDILYHNSELAGNTITFLAKSLGYGKSKKKKIKKTNVVDACQNPSTYFVNIVHAEKAGLLLFFKHLKTKLKLIITSPPEELLEIEKELKTIFPFVVQANGFFVKPIKRILLLNVFDYKKFSKNQVHGFPKNKNKTEFWERYDLAKTLNINTCAYCNRIYTFTVIKENGKGITSPSMDHFFDKSNFPLFALSFYNLIPSCTNCNSTLKGRTQFSLDKYIHPYLYGFDDHATFTYKALDSDAAFGDSDNLSISLSVKKDSPVKKQIRNSIKLFELDRIYTQHSGQVQELIKKKKISDDRYLDILMNETYPDLKLSLEDAYRLAFGNYYNEEDFQKRPMAKMTKDLVRELKMI